MPSFKAASIAPTAITTIVAQRDLHEKKMKTALTHFFRNGENFDRSPFPIHLGDVSAVAVSPSGTMAAIGK